ncbi:Rhomboid family protein [Rubripirellula lacrimiformis]|uniref:Rhomboid family protein n=1 Tax=Rubripirellula lacrimiformis TaxID=1930273 RepID=A0A517N6F4_9BACT|nr:rhomboid family intramembrane serine protease [Rubripirellula lacrimiformis]QDT02715.1 Rhomboid family protein [Rubripirellula lacrimiformis]
MLLMPYGTDAPTPYLPITTGIVMVLNVALFLATGMGDTLHYDWLIIQFHWIHPLQWISGVFMHASWLHLVGNMIFLWCFGQVVEGKIGWRRFAILYFQLAFFDGMITQLAGYFTVSAGGALGASGVIFALMVIAIIWAPMNDMHFLFIYYVFVREIDFKIVQVGLFYIACDFLGAYFNHFSVSTPVLHLLGVIVGIPFGVYMLRSGKVDCEGWDLFSRYGTIGQLRWSFNPLLIVGSLFRTRHALADAEMTLQNRKAYQDDSALRQIRANPHLYSHPTPSVRAAVARNATASTPHNAAILIRSLSEAIANEQESAAWSIFQKAGGTIGWHILHEELLVRLIGLLTKRRLFDESIQPLQQLVRRDSARSNAACLQIAKIQLFHQGDPVVATATLNQMTGPLSSKTEAKRKSILNACQIRR